MEITSVYQPVMYRRRGYGGDRWKKTSREKTANMAETMASGQCIR